jgi:hypothetical protein
MSVLEQPTERGKLPWQVRLYDRSRRWFDIAVAAARAFFTGTWLGALSRSSLHAIDELYYRRARIYHDGDYNLKGLFPWEIDALERHFHGRRSLLVTSAGGGREVIALERKGFAIFACECNEELARVANEILAKENLKSRVSLVPRDDLPVNIAPCDGAILGWSSYTLIQGRSARVRFLQRIRACLPPGAPILLSFFARERATLHLLITARTANLLRAIAGRDRVELGDDLVPNFVHHFSEDELAAELEAGGFRLVEFSREVYPHAVASALGQTGHQTQIKDLSVAHAPNA